MAYQNNSFIGNWCIPKNESNKWTGTLRITENSRCILEFVSTREDLRNNIPEVYILLDKINCQTPIPLINGYAKNEQTKKDLGFTLIDIELLAYSQSGLVHLTLEAKFCLTYLNIKNPEDLNFGTLMLKFQGLDSWINKNGFEDVPFDNSEDYFVELKYRQPAPIELINNDEMLIYFYFRASSPTFFGNTSVGTIEQSIFLNIQFKYSQKAESLERIIEKIQNFFTLVNGFPTPKTFSEVKISQNSSDLLLSDSLVDFISKEKVQLSNEVIERETHLFTFSETENGGIKVIENWLLLYNKYEPLLDLYFDTIYFNQGHIISRFVNILSVLEIYHSRKFNKKISLKEKIKELIFHIEPINHENFKLSDNFVEEVIQVRKYYVHGNEHALNINEDLILRENVLKQLRSLENLFKILLFLEIGLDKILISKIIKRKPWRWGLNS